MITDKFFIVGQQISKVRTDPLKTVIKFHESNDPLKYRTIDKIVANNIWKQICMDQNDTIFSLKGSILFCSL